MAEHLVVIALVVMATIIATMTIAFVAWLTFIRRVNEVSHRHRVGAPTRWLVSPTRPAMLHRRLRATVAHLRDSVPPPRRHRNSTTVQDLAAEVEALAAALDRELRHAAHLPIGLRTTSLQLLANRVGQVESLARRVARIGAQSDPSRLTSPQWDARATELGDRVTMMRDAQLEVDALEQQLGLG